MHPPISREHQLPIHRLPKRWPVRWSDWNRRRLAENLIFCAFAVGALLWVLHQAQLTHQHRHERDGTVCGKRG